MTSAEVMSNVHFAHLCLQVELKLLPIHKMKGFFDNNMLKSRFVKTDQIKSVT